MPQAVDAKGNKTYWCKCGAFVTQSPEALEVHVSAASERKFRRKILLGAGGVGALLSIRWVSLQALPLLTSSSSPTTALLTLVVLGALLACCCFFYYQRRNRSTLSSTPSTLYRKGKPIPECPEFDPATAPSVEAFRVVQKNTHCLFASKAKVWGGLACRKGYEREDTMRNLEAFKKFSDAKDVDGFVLQITGTGDSWESHGKAVFSVLSVLGEYDPVDDGIMKQNLRGYTWAFHWDSKYFFLTSFAGCYDSHHPRYTFGAGPHSFVMFQPGSSFSRHRITKEIREAIQANFKKHGRPLYDSRTVGRHNATVAVLPLDFSNKRIHRWWPAADDDDDNDDDDGDDDNDGDDNDNDDNE
eukprot:CAMPEP_0167815590 /NCGR_PEP_ID=MMETSP0112_2-20121227/3108_1 /TAXON_ID=91324 /ORGANISM="Lotharella globosa, Strain CCCM811" /LENGTH=356 /DNA_ID=CAMNT_0007715029 /DNA_START=6 /DNA_END=1076 /DNA_ORIENTATION=+